jgi:hypothetical protein
MAYKNKLHAMMWYDEHRESEIKKSLVRNAAYAERNRKIINDIRDNTPCTDCGIQYPFYVMDFDHTSDDKSDNVITLALKPVSVKKLMEEIAKCEIVCSNCHRIRTYSRRNKASEFDVMVA